ncbi:MAG TPA: DUF3306 domain-containing protein [Ramlibacter sp.]|nr:DUF3306 domain-containing protein [Ramlibacter sp.]
MAADGFLSRWSKRKQDANEGKPVDDAPVQEAVPAVPTPQADPAPAPPPPTLKDVKSLTFESDFKRFVTKDVDPAVKNAAVKKLFADPRFNVRDSMDVYADDYSIPDPLPESMLRKLAIAQVLKLFEDEEEREVADDVSMRTVAQSPPAPEAVPEPPHADPDLRLQQDDAPAGESAGDGIERGAHAPHDAVPPGGGKLPEGDRG